MAMENVWSKESIIYKEPFSVLSEMRNSDHERDVTL